MNNELLPQENYRSALSAIIDTFMVNKDNITTLYIVRHGQDELPAPENGYDQPLTEAGVAHAHLAGKRLAALGITQLLSSPLRRTLQTAEIIAAHTGLTNQVIQGLKEISPTEDFPSFARALNENARHWNNNNTHDSRRFSQLSWADVPGLENRQDLRKRAATAVNSILDKYPGQQIAIVSHYGFINAYISESLGLNSDCFFFIADTAISTVLAHGPKRALISLNDSSHVQ